MQFDGVSSTHVTNCFWCRVSYIIGIQKGIKVEKYKLFYYVNVDMSI